jgi:AraC-like DNA-binding protein
MANDQLVNNLAITLEGGKRSFLVLAHEPAVADHIGCKDGSHSALNAIHTHARSRGASRGILGEIAAGEEGLLEDRIPGIEALHGRALIGPYADLLADYFQLLARNLPNVSSGIADDLARATCDMLVVCLTPSLTAAERAWGPLEAVLLRRAKRYIESQLCSPELSPDTIAASLSVSRRTLYRVFEPFRGIHKYVQQRRLERVRQALTDRGTRRNISEIAADYGFARAFKLQFGISPAEARGLMVDKSTAPAETIHVARNDDGFDKRIRELGHLTRARGEAEGRPDACHALRRVALKL